ncbi:Protein SOK1 [Psilocybe cubensis]|uniref:Protein SOK1 n=2 Tax=Psilocybe cubensis TaxID=181762 RepID=A0ACB8GXQ3_PSICU|nr:Protein SOK1 [Psilocybe cubensis]KAH9480298.1 Protein SOK1 [Psilocybe cubensis]
MDDLAHTTRKRKQDQDDCPDQQDQPTVPQDDHRDPNPIHTPRLPWLPAADADDHWASPTSPSVSSPLSASASSKRPRLDALDTKRPGPLPRTRSASTRAAAHHHKILPAPLTSGVRQGSDIEDIGIVSTADPGPSSGSLLRNHHHHHHHHNSASRTAPLYETYVVQKSASASSSSSPPDAVCSLSYEVPVPVPVQVPVQGPRSHYIPPVHLNSPRIPPSRPLINRSTLKELELDIILRNPVIRHDLLFDPGLQFRPRRKRERFERYWAAVWEELQTGCTCVTIDTRDESLHLPKICVCSRFRNGKELVSPPKSPAEQYMRIPGAEHLVTLRQTSRIPALLEEFLEVMVFVIQPLSNTAVYTDPSAIREQAQEHSAHAAYLRAIFDPELIAQELRHGVFDPAGLFRQIGDTLKHHCAPMRDGAVEEMVRMAQRPGLEAFKAVRTCLELLELMKLDIANHQLTQLRPWLLRNTGMFEVKAFKIRFGADASLHHTRRWLHAAHHSLLERPRPIFLSTSPSLSHPSSSLSHTSSTKYYKDLNRNQQIYLTALKGVVDLIFDAEASSSSSTSNSSSPPLSPVSPADPSPSPVCSSAPTSPTSPTSPSAGGFALPETLYLDKTRIQPLGQEAASATALYMFMLLFRQLVFNPGSDSSTSPLSQIRREKVVQADMVKLKREIKDIGPACLAGCLDASPSPSDSDASSKDAEQMKEVKEALVLQIAKRACETRRRLQHPVSHLASDASSTSATVAGGEAPDPALLGVAQRWAATNMRAGAPLATLLHRRMRDVVFDAVVCLAYPSPCSASSSSSSTPSTGIDLSSSATLSSASSSPMMATTPAQLGSVVQAAGMESVADEIRRVAEDAARLALIHLNTHLPLYEGDGFFPTT